MDLDLDDIETWLDGNPEIRDEVRILVGLATSPEGRAGGRGEHFACVVLVSVVIALEQIDELRDRFVDSAADAITQAALASIEQNGDQRPSEALDSALASAVALVVQHVVDAIVPEVALVDPELLLALRLAAVLACPDPHAHREVEQHCVEPLALALLDERVDR